MCYFPVIRVLSITLVIYSISDPSLGLDNKIRIPRIWNILPKNESFIEFVAKMNYPTETVRVVTEDNYVLGIHRLPQERPTGKVVLIQHGMLSSSVDWVLIGQNKSIALLLHDLGYDVWLGNSRGNSYSRTHLNLSSTSKSFWDFSWHEIGFYDLPAIIDTILQTTGVTRLDYVGHSQGVTSFLVMSTLRPEYQQYFRTVIAMSPIAFMSHIPNTYLRVLSSNLGRFEVLLDTFKIYEVTPSNGVRARLSSILCSETSPIRDLCANILFITVGPGPVYLNKTILPNIFHNVHAGVSVRQILHYGNLINSGRFQHYDCRDRNMEIYNNPLPPDYPLQVIKGLKMHLFYGTKDTLMAKRDVHRLADHLRYTNDVYVTEIPDFNHLDYIFGRNVTEILYQGVLEEMLNNVQEEQKENDPEDSDWIVI